MTRSNSPMTLVEKLEAAQASVDAHTDQTGHDEVALAKIGRVKPTIVATCSECGQQVAMIEQGD